MGPFPTLGSGRFKKNILVTVKAQGQPVGQTDLKKILVRSHFRAKQTANQL